MKKIKSDGSTASYYKLPENATELQHLISHKNMNAQIGEIFRASYRYGEVEHSEKLRDAKKIKFYIEAEIERLEKYGE
jgi:Flp pilus assembly CpaF family ATPase